MTLYIARILYRSHISPFSRMQLYITELKYDFFLFEYLVTFLCIKIARKAMQKIPTTRIIGDLYM